MITIDKNELILLIDSWINYHAMLRVHHEDEFFGDALRKIIKANWEDVPEEFEENSVACAEHMVETNYKESY